LQPGGHRFDPGILHIILDRAFGAVIAARRRDKEDGSALRADGFLTTEYSAIGSFLTTLLFDRRSAPVE
jgi:hypothetical protein